MKSTIKNLLSISPYEIYSRIKLHKLKNDSKLIIRDYINTHEQKKLHIGAGGNYFSNWLNVDLEPLEKNIAYMDASKEFPLPLNCFDYIYSEHLFEHLSLIQQQFMLKECFRVLDKNGKIRIATPNFDYIVSLKKHTNKIADEYIDWYVETFFQNEIVSIGPKIKSEVFYLNNYFYNWGHQFIHNYSSIQLLLEKAGFTDVKSVKVYESEHEELKNLERHGLVIPKIFNDLETMVIEAIKI